MQSGDSDLPEGAAPALGREPSGCRAGPAQACSPPAKGSHVCVPVSHRMWGSPGEGHSAASGAAFFLERF